MRRCCSLLRVSQACTISSPLISIRKGVLACLLVFVRPVGTMDRPVGTHCWGVLNTPVQNRGVEVKGSAV